MSCAGGKTDLHQLISALLGFSRAAGTCISLFPKIKTNVESGLLWIPQVSVTHLFTITWRREWDSNSALMIPLSNKLEDRLFDNFGPLSNFAGKVLVARALDIVPSEVYEELEKIRRIRNAFAHSSKSWDFESEEIAPQLLALRKRATPKKAAVDQFMDCVSAIDEFLDAKQKAARARVDC